MRLRHLLPLAAVAAAIPARSAGAQFSPTGTYLLRMHLPDDTTTVSARVVVADSAGRLGGTYQNTSSQLVRRLVAVLVQPGPQIIVQIDRGQTFSTILMRVKGTEVAGEADFDGQTFLVVGTKN